MENNLNNGVIKISKWVLQNLLKKAQEAQAQVNRPVRQSI